MQQTTMAIAGMTCGGCVSAVQKALRAVPGAPVDDVTGGFGNGQLRRVTNEPSGACSGGLRRRIPTPHRGVAGGRGCNQPYRWML